MSRPMPLIDLTRALAFVLVLTALWMILTPYPGITHDGQGYALQALERLEPGVFGDDIFLRFQSQDDFTIFPPLQAAAIQALDLDRGTALLTLLFQVAWFVAAWLVLRQLLAPRLVLLGVGLLVVVPGYYGAMRIFQYAEPFLTARLPAEALSLLAIALYLQGRRLPGGLAVLIALLVHPLMAFPAVLLIGVLEILQRWGARVAWGAIALTLLGAIAVSALPLIWQASADPSWIELLRGRSPHLFLDRWAPLDWSSVVQVLATLAAAIACAQTPTMRRVAIGALAVGVAGLCLAAVATFWPQLELLLKGQAWRWLWLCRFFAIALLPAVAAALWTAAGMRRAAALFLLGSWLVVLPISARSGVTQAVPGMLAVIALGLTVAREGQVSDRLRTLSLRGAWVVFAFVVAGATLTTSLVASMQFADTADPAWLRVLGNIINMTGPAIAIVDRRVVPDDPWPATCRGGGACSRGRGDRGSTAVARTHLDRDTVVRSLPCGASPTGASRYRCRAKCCGGMACVKSGSCCSVAATSPIRRRAASSSRRTSWARSSVGRRTSSRTSRHGSGSWGPVRPVMAEHSPPSRWH